MTNWPIQMDNAADYLSNQPSLVESTSFPTLEVTRRYVEFPRASSLVRVEFYPNDEILVAELDDCTEIYADGDSIEDAIENLKAVAGDAHNWLSRYSEDQMAEHLAEQLRILRPLFE